MPKTPTTASLTQSIVEHLTPHKSEVLDKVVSAAKAGDPRAQEQFLRYFPVPKIGAELIFIEGFKEAGTLKEKGDLVLSSVAKGSLSPDQGSLVLGLLADYARVVATDDLEQRVKALELGEKVVATVVPEIEEVVG